MDLIKLGKLLRENRERVGVSRAELARRVGVTASYMWMIEEATPRKNGEPSQPSKDLIERWGATLGLSEIVAMEALVLAGHVNRANNTTRRALLTLGGFSFPNVSDDQEVVLQEIRQLLKDPRLSSSERTALLENLKSLITLLRNRYPKGNQNE